jgi:hypothetical protein
VKVSWFRRELLPPPCAFKQQQRIWFMRGVARACSPPSLMRLRVIWVEKTLGTVLTSLSLLLQDRASGVSAGYGFVKFADKDHAEAALQVTVGLGPGGRFG